MSYVLAVSAWSGLVGLVEVGQGGSVLVCKVKVRSGVLWLGGCVAV